MEFISAGWRRSKHYWRRFSAYVPFPWSSLKSAVNSKFACLTVIVPIVGWVLIYNDNLVLLLEELFEQDFSVEFSWRLYVFNFVLFLISVSSILYSVFAQKRSEITRRLLNTPSITAWFLPKVSSEAFRATMEWTRWSGKTHPMHIKTRGLAHLPW